MNKRLFAWASAVSLLLALAIVVAWVRSFWVSTRVDWTSEEKTALLSVSWGLGGVMFVRVTADPIENPPPLPRFAIVSQRVTPEGTAETERFWQSFDIHFRRIGFMYATRSTPFWGYKEYDCGLPFWFLFALTLVLPGASARRMLRDRHRRLHGLCRRCGYDLRGSHECCPECGRPLDMETPS